LIDPTRFAHIFVSPRERAQTTLDLLLGELESEKLHRAGKVTVTEDIAKWDYGDYDGVHPHDIRAGRKERGLDKGKPWDIWIDGCEGGEWADLDISRKCSHG
jgi:broad specificity phosphatase PhoE